MARKRNRKPINHTEVANLMRQIMVDFEIMSEDAGSPAPTWSKPILQYVKRYASEKKRDPLNERHAKLMEELNTSKRMQKHHEFQRGEEYNKQIVINQKLQEVGKRLEARERGEYP